MRMDEPSQDSSILIYASTEKYLEAEPALYLDHTAREPALGATEVWILNLRADGIKLKRLKVQNVEDVEEVGLDFKERSFAEQAGHPEALGKAQVNITVVWAAE